MTIEKFGEKLHFFGMFEKIIATETEINVRNIYTEPFNKIYSALSNYYEGEFDFYLKHITLCGERVLEMCSGDGSRYSIPLLKEGFCVDGVELSNDMIDIFKDAVGQLPLRYRKNSRVFNVNIFDFIPENKYDVVILPATTICLFADSKEILKKIFSLANRCLRNDGVFIFDYRIGPIDIGSSEACRLNLPIDSTDATIIYQEFWNYLSGWNIVNFYAEISGDRYLSSSSKRIFTQEMIYEMFQEYGFEVKDKHIYNRHNLSIEMIALTKQKEV